MIKGLRHVKAAGLAALVVLSALPAVAPAFAGDVKVGVLVPRTGRYAESGLSVLRGVEMVVKDVNAAGGIKSLGGAKIDLVVADNGSEAAKTSLEARRLMSEDKVAFIVGPYSTPEAQAFMPVADRYQTGGLGLQTTIVPTTPYFSTISISAEGFGKGYADLVQWLRKQGAKIDTAAITYANNDYGQVVAKTAAAALAAQGVKVLDSIPVEPTVKDMTPIVLKVKNLTPDAVISVVYFQDGVLLHKARFNLGYDDPIWIGGSAGFSDDKLWTTLGPEVAEKTLTKSFGLAFYSEDGNLPGLKQALAQGKAAYPDKILDQSFMFGVQAARMLVRALENAGSDDPVKVNAAFRALKFKAGAPEIVLPIIPGDMSYDADGMLAGTSPIFVQWKDGRKQIVYPEAVASAKAIVKGAK
ncbi:ABC transporter substrate-binding protein [Xanthobacter sp. VNH20]|jgi:branched-chain amino acid transport system substrate-binding protein|uniref:ABC transporter substrate-binding protein n=1 Tax=Xanthobacteraceae TaxID=335928 RepID=UPI0032B50194